MNYRRVCWTGIDLVYGAYPKVLSLLHALV